MPLTSLFGPQLSRSVNLIPLRLSPLALSLLISACVADAGGGVESTIDGGTTRETKDGGQDSRGIGRLDQGEAPDGPEASLADLAVDAVVATPDGSNDGPPAPLSACANRLDDDADGLVDLDDPGCLDGDDDDEIDAVPACETGDAVVDLNAALAQAPAYDGTLLGLPDLLGGSCGGGAGGEVIFEYRVLRPIDRLIITTDHEETVAPTVLYVRRACDVPEDLACDRGNNASPGTTVALDAPAPGLYYFVVDTGSQVAQGAFRLSVIEEPASACRNLIDDDFDGQVDLTDPGCRSAGDDDEADPAVVPECADDLDNDSNGATDYPADESCIAAGAVREGPACALPVASTEVGQEGGTFGVEIDPAGPDHAQGSCSAGQVRADHLLIVTLERPSVVRVALDDRAANRDTVIFIRAACDEPRPELGCVRADGRRPLEPVSLPAGESFVFIELANDGGGIGVFNVEVTVTPVDPACSDRLDNDEDGDVDLQDLGCVSLDDDDEANPERLPACANGLDDDDDGRSDYPGDEGCSGAGDPCEQPGFAQCGGVCMDVVGNEQNCGACGRACDVGVECLDGICGGLYVFEGVAQALPIVALEGWRECYRGTFADNAPLGPILNACDGDSVLIGCSPTGAHALQLAAMGDRDLVFQDTGDGGNVLTEHNGVGFYFSRNFSIGFVPSGFPVERNSCDVAGGAEDQRMCWHTGGDALDQGYRCGNDYPNGEYDRVIFTADPRPTPAACANELDDDADGLQDSFDPGCLDRFDLDEVNPDDLDPACSNGVDDDQDGLVDYPDDLNCRAAGDPSELSFCISEARVVDLGRQGGDVELVAARGDDGQAGSCGDGSSMATIVALELADPSNVTVSVTDADGATVAALVHIRRDCDEPETEIGCGRTTPNRARAFNGLEAGLVYLYVERTGIRAALTAHIEVLSAVRDCNDGLDNDQDGVSDRDDPGCTAFEDDDEVDPAVAPECSNGRDDDADRLTDYPADPECSYAGSAREAQICRGLDAVELGQSGGTVTFDALGPNAYSANCDQPPGGDVVIALTLTDPSEVSIFPHIDGVPTPAVVSIRGNCDDPASESFCRPAWEQREVVRRLEPGDHVLVIEPWDHNFGRAPDGVSIDVSVTSLLQACENRRDDDGDGFVDALDVGCEEGTDENEADPIGVPACANGLDDDNDLEVDFPLDRGCAALGDPCEQPGFGFCGGVCVDLVNDVASCGRCDRACDAGVPCLGGVCGGLVQFEGIRENVPVAELDGWAPCFLDTYADFTPLDGMLAACSGDLVLMGCRPTGSDVMQLAAMGERDLVFLDTGDQNNELNLHNGVAWYFSQNWSVGFVPEGEIVERNSCDTAQGESSRRMCWHSGQNALNGGYRCGDSYPDAGYERVVFHAMAPMAVVE